MNKKLLPRKTHLIQMFGDPDRRGCCFFADWWREPTQGGVIAARIRYANLDSYVIDLRRRGWHVKISLSRRFRNLKAIYRDTPS
jgi:hypothetical protein